MDSPLDLLSLQCFLEAAGKLNFRAAAEAMHLSPAAFGKRISALERQLGARLFERSTRRVRLTARGTQAIPGARQILEQCRGFAQELASPETPAYSLTLATRFELGLSWITPALSRLSSAQPRRVVHLSFGDSAEVIARVLSGQADAAVTSSRQRPPGTRFLVLHPEEYAFVGSAALLRTEPLRTPADAPRHTLLDIGPTRPLFRYLLDAREGGRSWAFRDTHYLGTIAAIRQRVLGGHGVAVLPLYFVSADLERRELIRIAPSLELESDSFRLTWLADHPQADSLRQLGSDLRGIPLV